MKIPSESGVICCGSLHSSVPTRESLNILNVYCVFTVTGMSDVFVSLPCMDMSCGTAAVAVVAMKTKQIIKLIIDIFFIKSPVFILLEVVYIIRCMVFISCIFLPMRRVLCLRVRGQSFL